MRYLWSAHFSPGFGRVALSAQFLSTYVPIQQYMCVLSLCYIASEELEFGDSSKMGYLWKELDPSAGLWTHRCDWADVELGV